MGTVEPEKQSELSVVVRSQIDAWVANLEVLSQDPRVRKFVELREKLFAADLSNVGPPGDGGSSGGGRDFRFSTTNCPHSRRTIWTTSSFPSREVPGAVWARS